MSYKIGKNHARNVAKRQGDKRSKQQRRYPTVKVVKDPYAKK